MKTEKFETDTIKTSEGELKITFIGHGTLMFQFKGKVIHVDPYSDVADYTGFPKADMILLTHEHPDHLDPKALKPIQTEKTVLVLTEICAKQLGAGMVMKNGDVKTVEGSRSKLFPRITSPTSGTTACRSIPKRQATDMSSLSGISGSILAGIRKIFRR